MKYILLSLFIIFSNCASLLLKTAIRYERGKGDIDIKNIQIEKFKIVYSEAGKGDSVLLIHGFGGDKDNWTRLIPYLEGKFKVISPDLPGFGESDKIKQENYSISEQVLRLKAFKEKLGISKFHIVGNSMGGAISTAYSIQYPEDILSLTLIDSAGVTSPSKSELTIQLEKGFNPLLVNNSKDYDRLMDFNFYKKPYIPDVIKDYFAEKAIENRPMNEKIFADIRSEKNLIEPNLSKINTPTLIIWGDFDKVIHPDSANIFHKGIKNSKLIIMKNCGHIPQIERPDEVGAYLKEFISLKK